VYSINVDVSGRLSTYKSDMVRNPGLAVKTVVASRPLSSHSITLSPNIPDYLSLGPNTIWSSIQFRLQMDS